MAIDTSQGTQVLAPANTVATRMAVGGVLFASTVFTSAFLLFLVQPLIGKYILPWFGGSPSVWTTCMLMFQALLFFGYAYAHLLTRLAPRWQAVVHTVLLVAAVSLLPITPSAAWKPTDNGSPALQIILLLMTSVGLPYFLLSATGPLLQAWFVQAVPGASPYRLYALSNVGSLLALLAYPFVIEPRLAKPHQTLIWSAGFAVFAVLCVLCALSAALNVRPRRTVVATPADETNATPVTSGVITLWFALSMMASLFLLATTNQVCVDVAVIPFLWVIPLALYLLTFILCFDGEHWYRRGLYVGLCLVTMPIACILTLLPASGSLLLQLGVYFTALFAGCMVCHGELVRLKPGTRHLTLFYMIISAGGCCGGLFAGLLAPAIFVDYYEFHLAVAGILLLALFASRHSPQPGSSRGLRGSVVLAVVSWMICLVSFSLGGRSLSAAMALTRNFYGTLKVEREIIEGQTRAPRVLIHGRIIHGAQDLANPRRRLAPIAYYGTRSGISKAFAHVNQQPNCHVGIIGLGIGSLSAFGRDGDRYRFYEINPAVLDFARQYFTFLPKCRADVEHVIGDARLQMEREPAQNFQMLVLDAFSGDAIPVHLLTREAFEVYLKHLAPGGLLVCHVSNVHFDLVPVVAAAAADLNLTAIQVDATGNPEELETDSTWILLARSAADLPEIPEAIDLKNSRRTHWTDDRNNLFEVLTR